jgi:hypothetical protein
MLSKLLWGCWSSKSLLGRRSRLSSLDVAGLDSFGCEVECIDN